MSSVIALFLPVLYLVILWLKKFFDKYWSSGLEAYPPENDSALFLERVEGKRISERGIVAAIIELAKEGYVKIQKTGEDYDVLLIREYDGKDFYKRQLMEAMFDGNNELTGTEDSIVAYPVCHLTKDGDLKIRLKEILKRINMEKQSGKKKIVFPDNKEKKYWLLWSVILIELVLMCAIPFKSISVQAILFVPFIYIGLKMITDGLEKDDAIRLILGLVWTIFVGNVIRGMVVGGLGQTALILSYIAVVISYFTTALEWVNDRLQKERKALASFRRMLKGSKKINELSRSYTLANPERFYEVLPYVCAIGKQDVWLKQHKDMEIGRPDWLIAEDGEDIAGLQECVDTLVNSVK